MKGGLLTEENQKTVLKSFRIKEDTSENIMEIAKELKITQAEVLNNSVDLVVKKIRFLKEIVEIMKKDKYIKLFYTTDYNMYLEFVLIEDENAKKNGYRYSCHLQINDFKPMHLYFRKISELTDLGLTYQFNIAKKGIQFNSGEE